MDSNPEPPPRHKRGRRASVLATLSDAEAHASSLDSVSDGPQSLSAIMTSSAGAVNPHSKTLQDAQTVMQVPPRQRRLSRRTSNPLHEKNPVDQSDPRDVSLVNTVNLTTRGDSAGYPLKDTLPQVMRSGPLSQRSMKSTSAAGHQPVLSSGSRRQVKFVESEVPAEGRDEGRPSRSARSTEKRNGSGARGEFLADAQTAFIGLNKI